MTHLPSLLFTLRISNDMLLVASDSDVEPERAGRPVQLPRKLTFLGQECSCQLKVCYRQFQNCHESLQQKRDAFAKLDRVDKALLVEKNKACYLLPQLFLRFMDNRVPINHRFAI